MVTPRQCKDCLAEGITTKRKAPHPGPRCTTHHRARRQTTRTDSHAKYVLATYGITGDQYWEIYRHQGGKCFICQRANGRSKRLAVDHNHDTGEVRGLLCKACNRDVLGHLRDDTGALKRAIEYLENPPARGIINDQR